MRKYVEKKLSRKKSFSKHTELYDILIPKSKKIMGRTAKDVVFMFKSLLLKDEILYCNELL